MKNRLIRQAVRRFCDSVALWLESQLDVQWLADAQCLANALLHDHVHTDRDGAVHARIGAPGLQDVERIGAGNAGGLVDGRDRAARARLDGAQRHSIAMERGDEVFLERADAIDDEVRAEAVHGQLVATGLGKFRVDVVEGGLADQQDRIGVRKARRGRDAFRPFGAGRAVDVGAKAHQAAWGVEGGGEPAGGRVAAIGGGDAVFPEQHVDRFCGGVVREGQVQGWHAGGAGDQLCGIDARRDRGHARDFALGQEQAVGRDEHPFAVVHAVGRDAVEGETGFRDGQAGTGFDRVDNEFGEGGHAGVTLRFPVDKHVRLPQLQVTVHVQASLVQTSDPRVTIPLRDRLRFKRAQGRCLLYANTSAIGLFKRGGLWAMYQFGVNSLRRRDSPSKIKRNRINCNTAHKNLSMLK